MKKNINIQEGNIRTIISIVLLLIALLVIDNAFIKILLAIIASGLAITSFLHYCPLKKYTCGAISNNDVKTNDEETLDADKSEEDNDDTSSAVAKKDIDDSKEKETEEKISE